MGVGSGSYEPTDREVVAVEPSPVMIAQRQPEAVPALEGVAESLLTIDTEAASKVWLVRDYFPEAGSLDRGVMPSRPRIRAGLPGARFEPVPVPRGCLDGFMNALWDRPEWLLDPEVRRASSTWHRMPDTAAERGLARLRAELENGRWDEKYGHLRRAPELDVGLRLVRAEL